MSDQPTLAPSLLLSMPQLDDPNFTRSVVLAQQHDADGAFGLVLNRPITTTARIVPQADPELATEQEVDVWIGGPVEPERSWILLSDSTLDEKAIRVCDGIYLSTSARVLEGVLQTPDQSRARLIAGYAGWGPGQLDEEVVASISTSSSRRTPPRCGSGPSAALAPTPAACSSAPACTEPPECIDTCSAGL
jgi:putative transcriptional regulator